ncbi:MAG: DJ-1/PfpI family protein [Acidobacteria bacterium]|nr:DJ-1/PfpI family protein [Acidobacteriota bacterium]
MKVGFPLYSGFDTLDVLGPFQAFTFAGLDRYLIAETTAPVTSFEGVTIQPHTDFEHCPQLDILYVPGGSDPVSAVILKGYPKHNPYLDFLIGQAAEAKWVCSVCTGALLLGAAGLLDGCVATTHWAFKDVLRLFPCHVVDDYRRYVRSGNRITGGGISSGIDQALYILSLVSGLGDARLAQLCMQYNPQPLTHCGDPDDSDIKDDPGMVPGVLSNWGVAATAKAVEQWLAHKPVTAS